ncbi:MAG: thiamine phosphate synthase [Pseudomonadota bacterium]
MRTEPGRRLSHGLDVFYPIVPDIDWLKRIVPLGARTIQLRLKDADDIKVAGQITEALEFCAAHDCQLIVNDYWKLAIELGADYVHLGQEDLAAADLTAIKTAEMRLGVSTHSEDELATALEVEPDYVALGPVFETKLKAMKWAPQGLQRVTDWKQEIGSLPLVGIAGITVRRADAVIDAGADSVAAITDFVTHPDPEARVRAWLDWAARRRPVPPDAAVRTT